MCIIFENSVQLKATSKGCACFYIAIGKTIAKQKGLCYIRIVAPVLCGIFSIIILQ